MPLEHGFLGKEHKTSKIEDPITQRNKMFEKVIEELRVHRDTMNASVTPASFIFRNSIQDGLDFARKAGLTPDEIKKATIQNALFSLSHRKTMVSLLRKGKDEMNIPYLKEGSVIETSFDERFTNWNDHYAELTPKGKDSFEFHLKWQDQEMNDSPKVFQIIEDYYREYLPYRAAELKKSDEEHQEELERARREKLRKEGVKEKPSPEQLRTDHMKKAENILLGKYLGVLDEKVFEDKNISEFDAYERVSELLNHENIHTISEIADTLWMYHQNKESEESLPVFFMKQDGQTYEWDLESARKPVAKIVENISAKKLREDLEYLCNRLGYRREDEESYKIIFDQVLNRHIATKQPFHRPGVHESAEEILMVGDIVSVFNDVFSQYSIDLENLSMRDAEKAVNDFVETNSELKERFEKADNSDNHQVNFSNYGSIEHVIDQFCKNASPKTKSYIEALVLKMRINEDRLEDVSTYLANAIEKKNGSELSDRRMGELFALLEDRLANGPEGLRSNGNEKRKDDFESARALLDGLKNPTLENLNKIFAPKAGDELERGKRNEKAHLRDMFKRSKQAFSFVKQMMRDKGRELLRTIGAVPDQSPSRLAEQLIKACFPAEYQAYQDRKKSESGFGNFFRGSENDLGLMKNRFESLMEGGNFGGKSKEDGPKMSVTLDKSYRGMMVTNVIAHDSQTGNWKRVHIPVDGDMKGNRKYEHIVAKKQNGSKNAEVIPTPFGAENIFTNRGTVEKDSLGVVLSPSSGEKLESWSYDLPTGHLAMENVSDRDYTRFLDRLVNEGGSAYLEKIPGLPIECQMFLDSIIKLSPRDRVIQIQKFVTSHLFYDAYDNPLREDMNRASVSDRIALMQERMGQIREELGDEVPDGMIFAGVCADATVIGEMMLRASGIAAGAAEGYNVSGNSFNSDHAHGLNVVVWPDSNGKNVLCEVDMTPSAITAAQREAFALAGINPVSVEKTIQESEQMDEQKINEIRERLDDVIKNLDTMSGDNLETIDIKQFQENLIDYINATCNLSDVYVFKRMIETYRYTPVRTIENDAQKKIESIGFMQNEYKRWTNDYQKSETPLERLNNAGKNLIGEFRRIRAQAKLDNESDQFNKMVSSVPEYLQTSLSAEHKKLWQLLGTYAKALK